MKCPILTLQCIRTKVSGRASFAPSAVINFKTHWIGSVALVEVKEYEFLIIIIKIKSKQSIISFLFSTTLFFHN